MGLDDSKDSALPLGANPEETAVLALMKQGITDTAELLGSSKLDPATFNQTLSMLEITGKIRPLGGGHFVIQ